MNGTLMIGILLVMGLVTLIAYVVGVYNLLVRLANNIDKAWSIYCLRASLKAQCKNCTLSKFLNRCFSTCILSEYKAARIKCRRQYIKYG